MNSNSTRNARHPQLANLTNIKVSNDQFAVTAKQFAPSSCTHIGSLKLIYKQNMAELAVTSSRNELTRDLKL